MSDIASEITTLRHVKVFRIICIFVRKPTSHRCIPLTKDQWCGASMILIWRTVEQTVELMAILTGHEFHVTSLQCTNYLCTNCFGINANWCGKTRLSMALQWRHNGRDSVSNHQPHDCLLNHLFRRRSKKTSKLRVTGLCAWNSPVTGELPEQMASNAENVSIWWRHHGKADLAAVTDQKSRSPSWNHENVGEVDIDLFWKFPKSWR